MANPDAAFGLRPVGSLDGAGWEGKQVQVHIPSSDGTATFIGDPVTLQGSADDTGVYPTVAQTSAGSNIDYVITGFEPDYASEDLQTLYRKASTAKNAWAVPVTDLVFEIQEDSDGGALAKTDVGSVADIIVGSGDTSTGVSGVELDSDTAATGSSAQLTILGLGTQTDNEIGDKAVWRVRVNESNLTVGSNGV